MKKPLIYALFTLAGFAIGYFISTGQNKGLATLAPSGQEENLIFSVDTSQRISRSLAKKMISAFQKENNAPGPHQMRGVNPRNTNEHYPLKGYFIDKKSIDSIFREMNDAVGLSLYLAKPENYSGPGKAYTVVFSGARRATKAGPNGEPYENGDAFDFVDPCPTKCGTLDTVNVR
jgi:hypothetical protein